MLEVSVLSVLTYNMGALNYSLKRLVRRVTHQSAVSNKNKIKAIRMAFFCFIVFLRTEVLITFLPIPTVIYINY